MTIKPVIGQKGDDSPDDQSPKVGSPKREKRKNVYEDGRHRRTPQKSCSRLKRDHQKRVEVVGVRSSIEREKHTKSPLFQVCGLPSSVASSSVAALGSPKTASIGSPVASHVGNAPTAGNVIDLLEETFSGYNSGDEHIGGRDAGLTPKEWKERDEKFVKVMSDRGFIVKEIEEDGACLFRAISLQIYGDQDMHEVIRQQTMDYIAQNREYFAQFVTEDITEYVKRKRLNNAHGNHIEIHAMSEIYNRPVELYCYQSKPINIFNSEQRNNGYEPLRLSYHRCSHYNAILDPYKASVGVGLGLAGYRPDELDHKQMHDAVRMSEELEIEQTMFEDKLKTTDWEATNEAIEEQIARESYLQWCRDSLQVKKNASSTVTSTTVSGMAQSGSSSSSFLTSSSCPEKGSEFSMSATSISGPISPSDRTSPNAKPYQSSDDGLKDSSTGSGSSFYDQSSVSSHGSSDTNYLLNFNSRTHQRRRRRHRHTEPVCTERSSATGTVPIPGLEMTNLNMIETKSTDSNDSDFSDGMASKKVKRRSNAKGEEQKEESEVGEPVTETVIEETQQPETPSSAVLTEPGPGPSNRSSLENEKIPIENTDFYHSLLEASYADDGNIQMTETEMIQRALQISRIDYIKKLQKHSDYDSP